MDPTPLCDLEVLILDGQTTGASPARGRLLELAWASTRASAPAPPTVRSHLVALPGGAAPSRRITALTGIDAASMKHARPAAEVWRDLLDDARRLGPAPAPAVVHFARFEEPFLRALHHDHGAPGASFPLEMVCSHRVAAALYPDLPRHGLRAVAGYLGHVLGPLRRAAPHVEATAAVWRGLVERLATREGVADLASLHDLLARPRPPTPRDRGRALPLERATRLALPDEPGVYRMLALGGAVLYVGKATSLRARFNSRYQKRRHAPADRTLELLTQTRAVSVTTTGSALEAALLESDEIKRLRPPYNRALLPASDSVWFASLDGLSSSPAPDARHVVGPLPAADTLRPLGELAALLAGRTAGRSPSAARQRALLALPDRAEPPGSRIVGDGLALFARSLAPAERPGPAGTLAPLLRAGARAARVAAREVTAAAARGDDDHGGDDDDGHGGDDDAGRASPTRERGAPWHGEAVATALAALVRERARLVGRAHLLAQLCEASVVFAPDAGDCGARLLVIEAGRVASAAAVGAGDVPPAPTGWRATLPERLAVFDVATYDRLRILTTELRRLVATGSRVRVRLGPRAILDTRDVARRLRWA
jgi:DNA polymerase-3 subunit epsilon